MFPFFGVCDEWGRFLNENSETPVTIALVVAVAENGIIGRDGDLPWRLSNDLKLFRRLTMGKPVIMGRKTYESIGRPLDGRTNIIVTKRADFNDDRILVAQTPAEAVKLAKAAALSSGTDEIMVIGGAEIYSALMDSAHRIYLTRVHAEPEGDTRFPELPPDEWRQIAQEPLEMGEKDDHRATLLTLERCQK